MRSKFPFWLTRQRIATVQAVIAKIKKVKTSTTVIHDSQANKILKILHQPTNLKTSHKYSTVQYYSRSQGQCQGEVEKNMQASKPFGRLNMSSRATGHEGLVQLTGAVVCRHAAPRVQLFASAGSGWPHNALRCYGIICSCQSAATSEIVKALMGTSCHRKQRYIKYRTFTVSPLLWGQLQYAKANTSPHKLNKESEPKLVFTGATLCQRGSLRQRLIRPSVCLDVRLSHAGIVPSRAKAGS